MDKERTTPQGEPLLSASLTLSPEGTARLDGFDTIALGSPVRGAGTACGD